LTFLFTDIEGSTRLWESDPVAMEVALAHHDALLRSVIEGGGGQVFKTVGDAFCSVFDSALDAVEAAVAVQSALSASDWVAPVTLRVRIGLHTGICVRRDGDYFGTTVNRTARVQAIAHGGQTIMSAATAELLEAGTPAGVAVRDLGEHRLKDLGQPEQIFQLDPAGLPSEFPPLRSLNNPALRHNLPVQVSSFVGRNEELDALRELLGGNRLVTLTGSGGCGKTRLALQAAVDLLDGSADGVWLAELAPLSDPDAVPKTVAGILGVREEPGRPIIESVCDALRERRLLLVLDNCEHLVDACAKLADALLRSCPQVSLLATSREPLRIDGERVHRIPSLAVPTADATVESLAGYESVRLFHERATLQMPGFALDETNVGAVASVCRQLDGIPLAIELAAARLRSMSLETIEARLDDRFRLLTGGTRTALPRHQTLSALVDWSFQLLTEPERVVLCRSSVFAGSFTLEAAEAVCGTGDSDVWQIADLLGSLVDKSLVQADTSGSTIRYRLLETIRQHASEHLPDRSDEGEASAAEAHARFFFALAETAHAYPTGPDRTNWMAHLDVEHDNLRAAMNHALTEWRGTEGALQFTTALTGFWDFGGHYAEGAQLAEAALGQDPDHQSARARAAALGTAATLRQRSGDNAIALAHLGEGLRLIADLAAPAITADLLNTLSYLHFRQGRFDEATATADLAVEQARESADQHRLTTCLSRRAMVSHTKNPEAARADYSEIMNYVTGLGDRARLAGVLHNAALLELDQGNLSLAREYLETELEIAQEVRDKALLPFAWDGLGLVAVSDHDYPTARHAFGQAIRFAQGIGHASLVAYAVLGSALSLAGTGNHERAITLHGGAARLLERLQEVLEPIEARLRDTDYQRLREAVGAAKFEAAFNTGLGLTPDEIIELALADSG
jgi:predicted ATPase/class 3 adenylate cyclase